MPLSQLARSVRMIDSNERAGFRSSGDVEDGTNSAITFLISPYPRLEMPPPKLLLTSTSPYAAVPRLPMANTILGRSMEVESPLAAASSITRLLGRNSHL